MRDTTAADSAAAGEASLSLSLSASAVGDAAASESVEVAEGTAASAYASASAAAVVEVMEVAIPEEVSEALEAAVLNCRLTFTSLFAGLFSALCSRWAEGMVH